MNLITGLLIGTFEANETWILLDPLPGTQVSLDTSQYFNGLTSLKLAPLAASGGLKHAASMDDSVVPLNVTGFDGIGMMVRSGDSLTTDILNGAGFLPGQGMLYVELSDINECSLIFLGFIPAQTPIATGQWKPVLIPWSLFTFNDQGTGQPSFDRTNVQSHLVGVSGYDPRPMLLWIDDLTVYRTGFQPVFRIVPGDGPERLYELRGLEFEAPGIRAGFELEKVSRTTPNRTLRERRFGWRPVVELRFDIVALAEEGDLIDLVTDAMQDDSHVYLSLDNLLHEREVVLDTGYDRSGFAGKQVGLTSTLTWRAVEVIDTLPPAAERIW